jgi:penicillin-binding protein 1C
MNWLGKTLTATLLVSVAVLVLDYCFPPPLDQALLGRQSQVVLAADGTPLRAFADANGVWRYPIALEDVSPVYLQALLNYEDRWFYRHPGVNPAAMVRAVTQGLLHQRLVSGGSTLTMQVARLIEPIPHSAIGKIKQMLRALQIESRLNKKQILELYLQYAPFGGPLEGVEAASFGYLGKSARNLSDAEAALLAVLPQRPSALRPDRAPDRAQLARNKVLNRLVELEVFDVKRAESAKLESVIARRLRAPVLAPLLAQQLRRQYPDQRLIQTTISTEWQRIVEARVANYMKKYADSTSAAVLIVDNQTMQARAYLGSANFADAKSYGHIDMVRAERSPGSTLKPTLYGMALDAGLIHSESLMIDAPQEFDGYRPANFSESFNGPISAAAALRLSLNVPAVDLLRRIGPGAFFSQLANAGVELKLPDGAKPNLSLILGGGATRLIDLVAMHAAMTRNGLASRVRLTALDQLQERKLLSPAAAWMVFQMLSEANRPDGVGSELFATPTRRRMAFKTGTSYGFRDAWALGSTAKITIGVWIGRPDGTPVPGSYGAVSALPLLFAVADALPANQLSGDLPKPVNVEKIDICWPLGIKLADTRPELCHRQKTAWVMDAVVPPSFPEPQARVWQSGVVDYFADPKTNRRLNLSCMQADAISRQVARWPAMAYPWLSADTKAKANLPALAPGCAPDTTRVDPLIIEGVLPDSVLKAPANRTIVPVGVRVIGTIHRVQWLLDDQLIGTSAANMQLQFDLPEVGRHRLVAMDVDGRFAAVDFFVR